jgi:RNA polymerase sigma-70 factor, ECF subfamily
MLARQAQPTLEAPDLFMRLEMTELKTNPHPPPDSSQMPPGHDADARAVAARVARESYGKLVAYLAATSRDVPGAEDALAEAFASALAVWSSQGVPSNPEGWLATAARRRLIDAARRRRTADQASEALELIDSELKEAANAQNGIPDRRLALMFACAHPAIEESIRAPLMLQTILGLDAAAIASAFLVSPAAMGQRLSRAKAKIRLAGVPFKIPEREDLPARLGVALEAIYAAFSHGWAEAFTDDPHGRNLAEEAIWLGRVVVSLIPNEPEAMGLLALMLYAHSRREARRDVSGHYVPLSEQKFERWDQAAILEAESLLHAASALGAPARFQLEAAVQSAHAVRRLTGTTDWEAIAVLYDALFALTASPVIAVNRAVAVAHARGPSAGLELLDEVGAKSELAGFEPYWVARADLCSKLGKADAARRAYNLAIGLQTDPAARAFLIERLAALV